ncbi:MULTISPECIES: hypothetical protein [unclassified Pseudomonas]|uniref:hypothetical protein n=1 Tax=unclassified Pseudomonas TaxID=196821 RepID=UPI0018E731A5|nr:MULTISPECIES: hypothetical protein [unclassified Pseudomonas]MBJ2303849.1 hypothetical protein [Pseudomonas sp. MF2846]MBK3492286.1 hypothetical protein [Pseudomonas sp. MF2857]
MAYFAPFALFLVLACSFGLGFLEKNWFLEFGLVVVVLSTSASMILAYLSRRKASQVENIEYESYLPEMDERESHSFKFTANLMGMDTSNPIQHLQRQIDEIKTVAVQDEKNYRTFNRMTNNRVGICLAQIRYHEEVTLPKMLGEGSGLIMAAGILTILGSAYLAFPADLYNGFAAAASSVKLWFHPG